MNCHHAVCTGSPYCNWDGKHAERHATEVCGDSTAIRLAITDARLPKDVEDVAMALTAIRADNFSANHHRTFVASRRMLEARTGLSARRVTEACDVLNGMDFGDFTFIEVEHAKPGTWVQHNGVGERVGSTWAIVRHVATVPDPASGPLRVPAEAASGARESLSPAEGYSIATTPQGFAPIAVVGSVFGDNHRVFAQRLATPPTPTTEPEPQTLTPVAERATPPLRRFPPVPADDAAPFDWNAAVAAGRVWKSGAWTTVEHGAGILNLLHDAAPLNGGRIMNGVGDPGGVVPAAARLWCEPHDDNGDTLVAPAMRCGSPMSHTHHDGGIVFAGWLEEERHEWTDRHGVKPGFWMQ